MKKHSAFWGNFCTVCVTLLLVISIAVYTIMIFVHALNENVSVPAIGPISGSWLTMFFESWYALVFGGMIVIIPILLLALINYNCVRKIFLAVGCAAMLSAPIVVLMPVIRRYIFDMLSGDWQDVWVNAAVVFKEYCILAALILIVTGATCLSVYACIKAIKGVRNEKNI